jgi:cytoskeletal protein CcmA (bactofilin family)
MENTMIGPGTTIRGNLTGEEDLVVKGTIEGSVRLTSDLTIDPSAEIGATIEAHNVDVSGAVAGDISASESVTVSAGASIVGDVTTPRISIADGATFKGRINMDFEV